MRTSAKRRATRRTRSTPTSRLRCHSSRALSPTRSTASWTILEPLARAAGGVGAASTRRRPPARSANRGRTPPFRRTARGAAGVADTTHREARRRRSDLSLPARGAVEGDAAQRGKGGRRRLRRLATSWAADREGRVKASLPVRRPTSSVGRKIRSGHRARPRCGPSRLPSSWG